MTELAIRTPSALTPAGIDFTTEQIDTLKRTIAKGASDTELDLFLAICRRTGLDPFLKQIHLIPRRSQSNGQWVTSYQPMVGIDGMRLTAERTGKYGGQDTTLFLDGETGAWEEVWQGKGHPVAAKAVIYRKDWAKPMVAIARWDSYVQEVSGQPTSSWKKMPDVMIGKCAESLGFRRAFPAEMSQLAVHMGSDFDTSVLEIETSERAQLPDPYYVGPDSQWQKDREAEDVIEAGELPFEEDDDDPERIGEGGPWQGEKATTEPQEATGPSVQAPSRPTPPAPPEPPKEPSRQPLPEVGAPVSDNEKTAGAWWLRVHDAKIPRDKVLEVAAKEYGGREPIDLTEDEREELYAALVTAE